MVERVRRGVERVTRRLLRELAARRRRGEELVVPEASYAPWHRDPEFNRAYQAVKAQTLVDRYRCYELWSLLAQTASLEGAMVEVGVYRGGTGALLAWRARDLGIDASVYLCDTYRGMVKTGRDDPHYRGGELSDTSREAVQAFVDRLGLSRAKLLAGIFPEETADRIAEPRLRFVHVDVDVYASARDVFAWAWPRLVPGGIVVYDDYGFPTCAGVAKHVEEVASGPDRRFVHNLNGHAILIKL